MNNFEKWGKLFDAQNMFAFNGDKNGLLWLKTRAICRNKQLSDFLSKHSLCLKGKTGKEKNRELFELLENTSEAVYWLDAFLRDRNNEFYKEAGVDESQLKTDLYKVTDYKWGGDQTNSLDKFLVSHYVKSVSRYDDLQARQSEIAENSWRYVQNSWYNNWTSYLIESVFKNHKRVISAVGEIKSVDFFIDGYPIDLKVTFFPNEFLQSTLKSYYGKSELAWLKAKAKEKGITFSKDLNDSQTAYQITEKMKAAGIEDVLSTLNKTRRSVIDKAQQDPMPLLKWLYEKQGAMRFGAENRLFVIVVNSSDMNQSWKMKREFDIITPSVTSYLDNFNEKSLKKVDFTFNGKVFSSLADMILIRNKSIATT